MKSLQIICLWFQFDGGSKLLQGSKFESLSFSWYCPQAGSFVLEKWAVSRSDENPHITVPSRCLCQQFLRRPQQTPSLQGAWSLLPIPEPFTVALYKVTGLTLELEAWRSHTNHLCDNGDRVIQRKSRWPCERRLSGCWTGNHSTHEQETYPIKYEKCSISLVFKEIQVKLHNVLLIRLTKKEILFVYVREVVRRQDWEEELTLLLEWCLCTVLTKRHLSKFYARIRNITVC